MTRKSVDGFEEPMLRISDKQIELVSAKVQQYYQSEDSTRYPIEVVRESIKDWFEHRIDDICEDLEILLTAPNLPQARDFRKILDAAVEKQTIFNGFKVFSARKLGAMMAYIASKGNVIYKTNLNKLLFYSDLASFYLSGRGISGATYFNLPFGPVPDAYEEVLNEMAALNKVHVKRQAHRSGNTARILPTEQSSDASDSLTPQETHAIDWALETFGKMSPSEISEMSHREKAYKFTRPNEPIAYEYAKFFEKLPPRAD